MNESSCIKCNKEGFLILRKKNVYCHSCFLANVIHKFRSSLGKNRLMRSLEKVLLGISGGYSSIVMLDIIHNVIRLDTHKKLLIDPVCVHFIGKL